MRQKKRLPQRTCVICRTTMAKRNLMRIVRTPEGRVVLDPRGKAAGRGAYLCPRKECFTSARARFSVARGLETDLSEVDWQALEPDLVRLAAERGVAAAEQSSRRAALTGGGV